MRHAFLIIAHNNWEQLKKLVQLLDAENHDIYIHIDKKSKDFKADKFLEIINKSRIFIYQEYEVFWGGFSQVQGEAVRNYSAWDGGPGAEEHWVYHAGNRPTVRYDC